MLVITLMGKFVPILLDLENVEEPSTQLSQHHQQKVLYKSMTVTY